jgi:hypothetical protein
MYFSNVYIKKMYHFLIFILLIIFLYEFIKRIKYLDEENIESFTEFSNPEEKYTYISNNFSDESFRMLDPPSYSKDIKKGDRNINMVLPATYPEEPDNFFEGLSLSNFRADPGWDVQQRIWQEYKLDLEPLIAQWDRSNKYKLEMGFI